MIQSFLGGTGNTPEELIQDIGDAYANRNVDGELGRYARNYINNYKRKEAEQAQKKAEAFKKTVESNMAAFETMGLFEGWSDAQKQTFNNSYLANGWSLEKAQSAAQAQTALNAQRESNAQKKADRADILAEIEAYKAGFSESTIAQAVATERQAWDEKINSTIQQAVQLAAQQGRVMDMSTYAMLRGRLEAQAANAIQQVQMNYEAKRMEYAANAISMKDSVYRNTVNTFASASDVENVAAALAGK